MGDRVVVMVDPETGEVAVHPKESEGCCGGCCGGGGSKQSEEAPVAEEEGGEKEKKDEDKKKGDEDKKKDGDKTETKSKASPQVTVPGAVPGRVGFICKRIELEDNETYIVEFDEEEEAEEEESTAEGQEAAGADKQKKEAAAAAAAAAAKDQKPALPPKSKALQFWQIQRVSSAVDEKVREKYPDRDWDEEELDEMEDEPSALVVILGFFFLPVRIFLFRVCCSVTPQKKILASTVLPGQKAPESDSDDDDDDDEEAPPDRDDEDDEDGMLDGFPIDCGTKDRKFLSMAKCKAVTVARHPNTGALKKKKE